MYTANAETMILEMALKHDQIFYDRRARRIVDESIGAEVGSPEWYQAQCHNTAAHVDGTSERLVTINHLLHAITGIGAESGALLDIATKHVWYGRPLDRNAAIDELGYILWYLCEAATALDTTLRNVMIRNTAKMRNRNSKSPFVPYDEPDMADTMTDLKVRNDPMPEMKVSEICHTTFYQQCHICDDMTCGDNRARREPSDD